MALESSALSYMKFGTVYLLVDGGEIRTLSEVLEHRGIGSYKPRQYPGLLQPSGSVDFKVQSKTEIAHAIRDAATNLLPTFDIEAGTSAGGQKHVGCKVDSLRLSAVSKDILKASLDWKGLTSAASAAATHSPADTVPLLWYEFSATGIPGSINPVSFDLSISNGVDWEAVLETPTAGSKRFAKYLSEGPQNVTLNLKLENADSTTIDADALAAIATVTLVFTKGMTVVTVTLTNCLLESKDIPFTEANLIGHGADYKCEGVTIT